MFTRLWMARSLASIDTRLRRDGLSRSCPSDSLLSQSSKNKIPQEEEFYFRGAGRGNRTPLHRLETCYNNHYTIPALINSNLKCQMSKILNFDFLFFNFFWSECWELDPVYMLPKHAYYRYTTLRNISYFFTIRWYLYFIIWSNFPFTIKSHITGILLTYLSLINRFIEEYLFYCFF